MRLTSWLLSLSLAVVLAGCAEPDNAAVRKPVGGSDGVGEIGDDDLGESEGIELVNEGGSMEGGSMAEGGSIGLPPLGAPTGLNKMADDLKSGAAAAKNDFDEAVEEGKVEGAEMKAKAEAAGEKAEADLKAAGEKMKAGAKEAEAEVKGAAAKIKAGLSGLGDKIEGAAEEVEAEADAAEAKAETEVRADD